MLRSLVGVVSSFGKPDVGAVISVYSSRYDEWQEGRILAYDAIRKMHMVRSTTQLRHGTADVCCGLPQLPSLSCSLRCA